MEPLNIVVIGSSGHARVIISMIESIKKYNIVGLIDSYKEVGTKINGYEIIGNEEDLPMLYKKHILLGGVVAIGNNWNRYKMVNKIIQITPEFNFISIIHQSAIISPNITIGNGTVIMPGVIINSNANIGSNCIINTQSLIEHDCQICDFASIAPGVKMGGNTVINQKTAIGIGTTIIEKITIGRESIVGAHSLVIRDVPDYQVWFGIPAKYVKQNIPVINYLR
ncbi:MAG: hypothetical protein A2W98_05010 [Bacteroidetes bacterium GWF2_33_38]|nr:MAG: hypothetical protein A2W98_05010 [Bacteroidetes bacterium GWF2_33_38]OFY68653.1 MAG: hypothetical protein A2265_10905 [Bacteroidetes bacterium RIFOXYA12_FULL_33_9]OFY92035.1 MAG: hypothetical protein A2236_06970 [Bacteroidetes bacterium RIFOXYA2_FULL_33_7]